ncbi:MAG: ATP-binding protein [Lagierella massiliensis]|nr:ATP-binding protein [Lagierella massiliensis]
MNDYLKVGKILENRRHHKEKIQKERLEEVFKKVPEYKKITNRIERLNISHLYEMKNKSGNEEEYLKKVNSLKEKRRDILIQSGYPEDYLNREYFCNICKDTGEIEGRICTCKKDLLVKEKIKQSSLHSGVKNENFENFDFDLFSDEKKDLEPLSPRDLAKNYYEEFKEYCKNFSSNSKSLFITGPVGTGKTYFCNCISHELIKKNFNVVYLTSQDLMRKLKNYNIGSFEFEEKNRQDYELIVNSDLLIIDDLGSEQISNYNISNFFNLINERLIRKKPVIISTNIAFNEIRDIYDERIYSRLKSYELCLIYGDDLRDRVYK